MDDGPAARMQCGRAAGEVHIILTGFREFKPWLQGAATVGRRVAVGPNGKQEEGMLPDLARNMNVLITCLLRHDRACGRDRHLTAATIFPVISHV